MYKKILLIITTVSVLLLFSACSYFLPAEVRYDTPELRESEKVVMPSIEIRMGDLYMMYDLSGTFVPEPTKLFKSEFEISGAVKNIYFTQGDEIKKGDLVMELNTDSINDKIQIQEISVAKTKLSHEQNQILFETGKIDKYSMELSSLTLKAAENYLSDLREELDYHYLYATSDGVLVFLNFDIGDNAFGEAFGICKTEDGIFEVMIKSTQEFTDAELALIEIDMGEEALVIYEGVEYRVELLRDYSTWHVEFGFDPAYNHIQFKSDEIPPRIAFNKSVTVRNITEQAEGAIVIPMNAVYSPETNPYTYVIKGDEIEKRFIEIGMNDLVFYEVLSGLSEGENILKIN